MGAEDEIRAYAESETFPELQMDAETAREVQEAWIKFCALKGSPEAAEDAVHARLRERAPEFAQLLFPDRAVASSTGKKGEQIDPTTGRVTNAARAKQHIAAIMTATQDPGLTAAKPGAGLAFDAVASKLQQLAATTSKCGARRGESTTSRSVPASSRAGSCQRSKRHGSEQKKAHSRTKDATERTSRQRGVAVATTPCIATPRPVLVSL
mmetsp:Transcript_159449/g.387132  ORF Transcript_159449/g.387132 Transcript_159449/m.387132 type:complete len:210 (-) Transcript_159449:107-736(-)